MELSSNNPGHSTYYSGKSKAAQVRCRIMAKIVGQDIKVEIGQDPVLKDE